MLPIIMLLYFVVQLISIHCIWMCVLLGLLNVCC